MMKKLYFIPFVIVILFSAGRAFAIDPPHGNNCDDCHTLHGSQGPSLTNDVNSNLCMSCHTAGDVADAKRFDDTMQAIPGISGTSHRWDASMPATSDPNNAYGLRASADLNNELLKTYLIQFEDVVTCSVCHQQHEQRSFTWDPFQETSGTATGGTTTTLVHTGAGWGIDQWAGYSVTVEYADLTQDRRWIRSNTVDTLTLNSNDPPFSQDVTGRPYTINGGSFQRVDNDLNQLCEDCHYYRVVPAQTDTRTWDGNKKSHPIVKDLTTEVADPAQFVGAAPLENNGNAQATAPRYHENGTGDTNITNNIVLDSSARLRCLSCHGIHYTDSDSSTVDQP